MIQVFFISGFLIANKFQKIGFRINLLSYCNLGDEAVIGALGEDHKLNVLTLDFKKKESNYRNFNI